MHWGAERSGQDVGWPSLGSVFVLLWLSETLFDLGSAVMSFALGVWIRSRSRLGDQLAPADGA